MLEPAVLWVVGIALVVLPFVLSVLFNGTHQADSRGRRIRRTWTGRPLRRS